MLTFEKFIEENPRCKKYSENKTARSLFIFMSEPENIDKMITANNKGRPALEGILSEVENKFNKKNEFDIEKDVFVRHTIGIMVREVLKEFGFVVDRTEINRQKNINAKYIKSATHYKYNKNKAKKKIKKIVSIINV
jgi:hypothetical protein